MKSGLPKTGTSLNWLKAHVESASKSLVVSVSHFVGVELASFQSSNDLTIFIYIPAWMHFSSV